MWELIRSNQRKSAGLITIMGFVLAGFGAAMGTLIAPGDPAAITFFVLVAIGIWLVMLLASLAGGERILLASAHAREIQKTDAPQLFNVVEEMSIASGLNVMPKVYLIDSPDPNAFAVGLKPKRAAVAVTTGLLSKLNRDELQGVMAHEIAHIQNRDTLFMTLAGVTLGAIILLSELAWRSMYLGSMGRRRSSSSKGGGQGAVLIMVLAVIMAILAPILARLLYFACSRRREYLADACAAQYTRFPEGLASALEKISGQVAARQAPDAKVSRTLAPMYIINPLAARGQRTGWFSTHPSTDDRIKILRGMTDQSSLAAYEEAYRALHPKETALSPGLRAASVDQPVRAASKEDEGSSKKQWRAVQDLLHKADRYAMLACACGVKIKVPPAFSGKQIACPKCGSVHPIPTELLMATQAAGMARL